ncbi:DMT family transporter [Marinobacter sp. 1Y8]
MTERLDARLLLLIALAMLAFASNSVLGRFALGSNAIDPGSYTLIRLASGAIMLWIIARLSRRESPGPRHSLTRQWFSGVMLVSYALCFSFAYVSVDTGTGALILFGMVQLTMVGWGVVKGERPSPVQWLGSVLAIAGLGYLVSPGVTAPPLKGAVLMALSGVAWGVYSLRGKGVSSPVQASAENFLWALPLAVLVWLLTLSGWHVSLTGVLLAVASGALASGLGYVLWYRILPAITSTTAATVQLSVPVIASVFGVLLLSEPVTTRLVLSSVTILGGIGLVIAARRQA